MNEVKFVDTTLRDGQASLWAENMRTGMMLLVAERLDSAGFQAIEVMASSHYHHYEHSRKTNRAPDQRNPVVGCACGCGRRFRAFDKQGRSRRYVSGHNTGVRHGR